MKKVAMKEVKTFPLLLLRKVSTVHTCSKAILSKHKLGSNNVYEFQGNTASSVSSAHMKE